MTYPESGQNAADHQGLDDQNDWVPEFNPKSGFIDGCLTVTGDTPEGIQKLTKKTFDWVFNIGNDKQSVEKVYSKDGIVYPDHREQLVFPTSSSRRFFSNSSAPQLRMG